MNSLIRTLAYHNGVPIALGLFLLLAATTLAATDGPSVGTDGPDTSRATSTDSMLEIGTDTLLDADIAAFDMRMRVTTVDERADSYEVSYAYRTLAIGEGAWQALERDEVLTVPKDSLASVSLEAYIEEQLREVVERERAFLARAQALELAMRSRAEQASISDTASAFGSLTGLIRLSDTLLPPAPGVKVLEPVSVKDTQTERPVPENNDAAVPIPVPVIVPSGGTAPTEEPPADAASSTPTDAGASGEVIEPLPEPSVEAGNPVAE